MPRYADVDVDVDVAYLKPIHTYKKTSATSKNRENIRIGYLAVVE